ncbi:hypothetical protein ES708_27085 [subsurface metagenome]
MFFGEFEYKIDEKGSVYGTFLHNAVRYLMAVAFLSICFYKVS